MGTTDREDEEMTTMVSELATRAEQAVKSAEQERRQLRARHRQELAAADKEIKKLRSVARSLRPRKRPAAQQAGPGAIEAVVDVLRDGAATQKQIVSRTKLNEGTVSYAVRALIESGSVELTGEKFRGSRELRIVRGKTQLARSLYEQAREVIQEGARVAAR